MADLDKEKADPINEAEKFCADSIAVALCSRPDLLGAIHMQIAGVLKDCEADQDVFGVWAESVPFFLTLLDVISFQSGETLSSAKYHRKECEKRLKIFHAEL